MEVVTSTPEAEGHDLRDRSNGQTALLHAEGLCKSFGGQTVLDEVSLELHRGEVVLLRGANGSGKTTLLNILTGNLKPDAGHFQLSIDGTVEQFEFPRSWWQELNPFDHFLPERMARGGVGRMWQDIRLFSTQNLQDNIAAATPEQTGEHPIWTLLRRPTMREEKRKHDADAESMLASMGLEGREASSGDKVSLGQAKRVAILRAVQAGARILFLDEPLEGLDAPGIADVVSLLKRLAYEKDITLVVVEHVFNIPHVLELEPTVWTLDQGRLIVESSEAVRTELNAQRRGGGLQDWIRSAAGSGEISSRELPGGAVLSTFTPQSRKTGENVLEVEDLVVRRGRRLVIGKETEDGSVEGLSFSLRENEWGVLKAPNGWGKTTLLEVIAGILPATRGTVRLRGRALDNAPAWERDISLLQSRDHTFPTLSVQEELKVSSVQQPPAYIEPLIGKRMASLSGGEKQKVALTCAIKGGKASTTLLDEPFSALDAEATHTFSEMLRENTRRKTLLIAVPGIN